MYTPVLTDARGNILRAIETSAAPYKPASSFQTAFSLSVHELPVSVGHGFGASAVGAEEWPAAVCATFHLPEISADCVGVLIQHVAKQKKRAMVGRIFAALTGIVCLTHLSIAKVIFVYRNSARVTRLHGNKVKSLGCVMPLVGLRLHPAK